MKTEIISIGTELLMGYVVDTNSTTIAQELLDIGIGTYYRQIVGDNPARLREAIELAAQRSDLILFSGGLGPTKDDITKEVVADYVEDELVEDPEQLKKVVDYFTEKGVELPDNIYRQAHTLKNGTTFFNEVGLACGTAYETEEGKQFILMPGPPFEMLHMLKQYVKPYLREKFQENAVIESLYLNFYGIGESRVAERLDDLVVNQTNPTVAIYARPRQVTVRLTANALESHTVHALNQKLADQIVDRLEQHFIGYGEGQTIEAFVVEKLKEKSVTLSVVEGITGGLVMESLTEISGVSAVFLGGLVAYQPEIMQMFFDRSDVAEITEESAGKLACETAQKFHSDIGLSVIGTIDYDESREQGSGTVYIGLAEKDRETQVKVYPIQDRPKSVFREVAKNEALAFVREKLF